MLACILCAIHWVIQATPTLLVGMRANALGTGIFLKEVALLLARTYAL